MVLRDAVQRKDVPQVHELQNDSRCTKKWPATIIESRLHGPVAVGESIGSEKI